MENNITTKQDLINEMNFLDLDYSKKEDLQSFINFLMDGQALANMEYCDENYVNNLFELAKIMIKE